MVQRTVGSHLRTVMIMLPAVLTPMFGLAASHSALAEELDELPNPAHASLVATGAPIYIGCFADCGSGSLGNRDLPHNAGNLANDTPVRCSLHLSFGDDAACLAECGAGWQYIGLQDGQDCFCGNTYGRFGPSSGCSMPCTGNKSAICGGPCANSIYYVGSGPIPPPPSPPPLWPPLPEAGTEADPSTHDVTWTSPSDGPRGAMPLGNGECSASVWVDRRGDVYFYLVRSDSIDELASRDKLARIRLRLDPPLDPTASFTQRLVLANATVAVTAGNVSVQAFVDANTAALRVRIEGTVRTTLAVSIEVWRNASTLAQGEFCEHWNRSADTLITQEPFVSDSNRIPVLPFAVGVCHSNPDDVSDALIAATLKRQGIDVPAAQPINNPMRGRTFGAWVSSGDAALPLQRINSTTAISARPAAVHSLLITMLTTVNVNGNSHDPISAANEWATAAATLAAQQAVIPHDSVAAAHTAAWVELWNRSWVHVSTPVADHHNVGDGGVLGDPTAVLTLQRFLDLANGRGAEFPIHGGGQAWGCEDDGSVAGCLNPTNGGACDPDRYQWWTSYWQEGRHPYYSALMAGDGADLLPSLYRLYTNTLPLHAARVKSWWNHSGAVFPERFYLFGPIDNPTYGCNTPPASPDKATGLYQKYHIVGSLLLCSLGLDDFEFYNGSTDATAAAAAVARFRQYTVPICVATLTFYAQHYSNDANGKLDMFPSQAEETWQCPNPANRSACVTNPASDIAGLWAVTTRLAVPTVAALLTSEDRAMITALRPRIPPLPVGARQYGPNPTTDAVYLPAASVPPFPSNSENVELHAVFPLLLAHVGEESATMSLDTARATYAHRPFPCGFNDNWCEDGNVAALLGFHADAAADVLGATTVPNAVGWRFPTWHAGGGDTVPTMMPQSIMRQTLHSMLLQYTSAGEILLFPAWPPGWDVAFRLHAPRGTVVTGRCVRGVLVNLTVTPIARRTDVRLLGCNSTI